MFRSVAAGLTVIACVCVARAQDESFRFFFDASGAGEEEPYSGTLAFTNPTVYGSGTLYLWVEYGTADQHFTGVNLVVDITGPAVFTSGMFYDHDFPMMIPPRDRWGSIPRPVWNPADPENTPQRWVIGSAFTVGSSGTGFWNSPAPPDPRHVDTHFTEQNSSGSNARGATLAGVIGVRFDGHPGELAEIRLQNGTSGSAGVTILPSDFVYFGFGDAAVPNKRGGLNGGPGGPTPIADAFVAAACQPCDTNCDNSINAFDIQSFVDALNPTPPPGCSPCAADANGDGSVNGFDIEPFLRCLGG